MDLDDMKRIQYPHTNPDRYQLLILDKDENNIERKTVFSTNVVGKT